MKFIKQKIRELWQTVQDFLMILIMIAFIPIIFLWAWLVKKATEKDYKLKK